MPAISTERWYDWFSYVYDLNCELTYWAGRLEVARRFGAGPGRTFVDVCCGTGANFPHLAPLIADGGRLVAIDMSAGMLRRAEARAKRLGLDNVSIVHADARRLADPAFRAEHGLETVDAAVCTLGLSVVPDWEAVLRATRAAVRPQGRLVVMDGRPLQGRLRFLNPVFLPYVHWMARADTGRPIEAAVAALTDGEPAASFLLTHIFVTGGVVRGSPAAELP